MTLILPLCRLKRVLRKTENFSETYEKSEKHWKMEKVGFISLKSAIFPKMYVPKTAGFSGLICTQLSTNFGREGVGERGSGRESEGVESLEKKGKEKKKNERREAPSVHHRQPVPPFRGPATGLCARTVTCYWF